MGDRRLFVFLLTLLKKIQFQFFPSSFGFQLFTAILETISFIYFWISTFYSNTPNCFFIYFRISTICSNSRNCYIYFLLSTFWSNSLNCYIYLWISTISAILATRTSGTSSSTWRCTTTITSRIKGVRSSEKWLPPVTVTLNFFIIWTEESCAL